MTRRKSRLGFRRSRRRTKAGRRRSARFAAKGAAAAAVCLLLGGLWVAARLQSGLPDGEAIGRIGQMSQATVVYDAADQLAFTIYKEQRIDIPLKEMSPHVVPALLAVEDRRFYEHQGFDLRRTVSAALTNLRYLRAVQGGSTITQQLARQSFLTSDKTFRRKLQELILARRIERLYTKPRILELYLNKVYLGAGLYGVEAASRGYFGKQASQLTLAEAAMLVGLAKAPSTYAPTASLEHATARRGVVLQAMLDTGQIDGAAREEARTEPVALRDGLRAFDLHGQYFKEQVRSELVERFGWERVYQGGLRVFSTINVGMQRAAEAAVAEGLKGLDAWRERLSGSGGREPNFSPGEDGEPLQAALVAMDPATGYVGAMVGGRDFAASPFNRAVQARRQPGSAFKPFVYAAALENGYTPATVIRDLAAPIATSGGAWTPDETPSNASSMNLRMALRISSNRAAAHLLQDVGIPRAVQYAKAMGIEDMPSVASLALGSGEVTLQSLTAAFATFANRGRAPRPLLIRRVEDGNGEVLYAAESSSVPAITEETAFLMSNMLAEVFDSGTAASVRRLGFTLPAAGKTGTTNDVKDAWLIGFTPSVVAGVWVGFDRPRTIVPNGSAGDIAAPIWATFMKKATHGAVPEWLPVPAGVTEVAVCALSGRRASDSCRNVEVLTADGHVERHSLVYTEYFTRGTEPLTPCDLHRSRGLLGAMGSFFRGRDSAQLPRLEDIGLPAAPVARAVRPRATPPAPEPPQKKRSFWRRIFGFD